MKKTLFIIFSLLASCVNTEESKPADLSKLKADTKDVSAEETAGGMKIRQDDAAPVQIEKKKCLPKAQGSGAAARAPQIEVGIAKPVGNRDAAPHAYTRFEDCIE